MGEWVGEVNTGVSRRSVLGQGNSLAWAKATVQVCVAAVVSWHATAIRLTCRGNDNITNFLHSVCHVTDGMRGPAGRVGAPSVTNGAFRQVGAGLCHSECGPR